MFSKMLLVVAVVLTSASAIDVYIPTNTTGLGVDCATQICPSCGVGEEQLFELGKCCPDCVPAGCFETECPLPKCLEGHTLTRRKGECCRTCTLDCRAALCPDIICNKGFRLEIPEGQCCSRCVPDIPDCSAISCLRPICEEGEELVVPEGECCPQCQPVCIIEGQTFSFCASRCPRACNSPPDIFCPAVCVEGCKCPSGQVVDTTNNKCVPEDECPPEDPCDSCPEGTICVEKVNPCQIPPCPVSFTCKDPDPCSVCPKGTLCRREPRFCINPPCGPDFVRCLDPDNVCSLKPEASPCKGSFRNFFYNSTTDQCELFSNGSCGANDNEFNSHSECISACDAINPCIGFVCQRWSSCRVDDQTGKAFCEPSCDLDNGGCRKDQICELQIVSCVNPPCPPKVNCIDPMPVNPCATVRCANGYQCEVFKSTGEAYCQPNCSLNNGGCPADQECRLQPVICVRAPCPPVIECVERTKECPPTCSKEFCSKKGNRRAMCSSPGPREIPGCTGSCQLTYCHACYYDEESHSRPEYCPECENLEDYLTDSGCFRRWAKCVRRDQWLFGHQAERTEENFRCHSPPCPLRG